MAHELTDRRKFDEDADKLKRRLLRKYLRDQIPGVEFRLIFTTIECQCLEIVIAGTQGDFEERQSIGRQGCPVPAPSSS